MVVGLLGGLGMFIYGMRQMSEGLQKAAGKKLKQLLEMLTTNRIAGVFVGAGVTAIIQSSSATTVMVVGFVNAGLMTLAQSIGVIMGANIGTTVTAQLIAFKLSHYSLHAIAIGAFFYLFAKKDRTRQIGQIILGFGILFLGLTTMKDTMRPLRDSVLFVDVMQKFGVYPVLGLMLGTLMTIVLQSSSASIGILISLVSVGIIDYEAAIPILLGNNIGTTITAILSSIGANRNAKRAAAAHATFNVLGAGLVVCLLYIIPDFSVFLNTCVASLSHLFGQNPDEIRMIANTHTVFNVLNTLIWFPFVDFMVKIVNKIIPKGEESKIKRGLVYLDERMLETPSMVMEQVKNEIIRMHEIVKEMIYESKTAFLEEDLDVVKSIKHKEEIVNEIEKELLHFLTSVPVSSLSEADIKTLDMYFAIIDDIESMGDDADNIATLTVDKADENIKFSDNACQALNEGFDFVIGLLDKSIQLVETEDLSYVPVLMEGEEKMDQLEHKYRDEHMRRLNKRTCNPSAGIIYLEGLEDIEHISDQFADVAQSFLEREEGTRSNDSVYKGTGFSTGN